MYHCIMWKRMITYLPVCLRYISLKLYHLKTSHEREWIPIYQIIYDVVGLKIVSFKNINWKRKTFWQFFNQNNRYVNCIILKHCHIKRKPFFPSTYLCDIHFKTLLLEIKKISKCHFVIGNNFKTLSWERVKDYLNAILF